MTSPAGISHAAQWDAWERTWAYLLAPEETDSTGRCRSLVASAWQQEARANPTTSNAGSQEDTDRDLLTSDGD